MYYVYLIRDKITKEIYTGYTGDLKRRMREHYTKHPELLYYEAYKSEKDARLRERKLKQRGQGIRWLRQRIRNCLLT